MVQALLEVMPPTATDVTVDDGYMSGDPFSTIANAADTEMVGILMEDFDGFTFDEDDTFPAGMFHEVADCDLAVDDDGELVYRDEALGWVGL